MRHRIAASAVAVVMALAACGGGEPAGGGDAPGPAGLDGSWVLVEGAVDGAGLSLDPGYRVTMTIDGAAVGGRAACNSYGGEIAADGATVSIGSLSGTEMACEPPIMETEAAFLGGLLRTTEASRAGDTLLLTGPGIEFTFSLLPPVPTADLVGATWVLDTIIQGEIAASAEPATLRLDPDGTLTGSTGCRDLTGEYVVAGDTVLFTSFSAEGDCPGELRRQDDAVVTVLGDGFTVEIEGGRLTVMGTGGEGLSYRASGS